MTKTLGKGKLILSLGIMAAVLVIGITLWIYYKSPSSYLALDVNPSIEIHTNRLNEVTSIEPVNEDAKQIMVGYELTDKNLETVIKNIVDRMILNGFIAPDKDNQILITTDENQNSTDLTAAVDGIITNYLTEKQVDANVIPQSIKVTTQSIEEAHKNHVSAGKMAIIQRLMKADSTLKLEDLTSARVSDLVALAKSKNISLVGLGKDHATQDITAVPTVTNDVNIEDQNDNDNDKNDNDIEDDNDGDNDKQDDADIKDQKHSDKENQSDLENEDQEDNDIEDQHNAAIRDQKDFDKEDQDDHNTVQTSKQKQSYSQDLKDNENDNFNEDEKDSDYEYHKSSDSEDQKDNDSEADEEKDSDSEYTNQTENHNYDHESDSEND